jgi:hypothetical protein
MVAVRAMEFGQRATSSSFWERRRDGKLVYTGCKMTEAPDSSAQGGGGRRGERIRTLPATIGKAGKMSKTPQYIALSPPRIFVWRMFLFVTLAGLVGVVIQEQAKVAFFSNPVLNSLILAVLGVGVIYTFQQVLRLYPEIRWVNSFRMVDPGLVAERAPVMLAPMAMLLRRRQGQAALSTTAMRSMLDSIAARLDEARETTRYLVSLLVFLGLLGTFWGLLQTLQSVGGAIQALDTGSGDGAGMLSKLKESLEAPLRGMGTAFSASLFGLAGSLVLGFLDLQAGHAQNRFYNELEEWLSAITEIHPETLGGPQASPAQLRFALLDMQRTISDLGEKIEHGGRGDGGESLRDLSIGIERLVKQMRSEQQVVREWVEDQAHQQAEIANALRQHNELAVTLRDIAKRSARRD